ncbi:CDP-alcohol phosphatidyltransferase family protein [Paludisphaera mucosa]|uniref:Phosphatidylcholine synthase n=1 Tax=Paludisphaera mucosa TaxID=3030827 RepID=A0ABT6FGG2_9BACT|nr:CDP-alcohol phosphatidyltransferase family protein [Paludisphaera mucosa]MDG3006676.1 CDP-alcohol phosphatidyltransferase [Paludisphaera mucosa]
MVETLESPPAAAVRPGPIRRFLGWCVHAYTASGLAIAAVILALLVEGGPDAFRWSFLLMLVAVLVDASDGTFARAVRIKEAVPSFDGRRLDDITDFLTYTFLPLMLVWRAGLIPPGTEAWLIAPLLASAYGFCQVDVKTPDGYFLGFPSLWNVVAFYLYVLPIPQAAALGILLFLAILTFVPVKHLYPSQPGPLNRFATITGIVWGVLMVWLLWILPTSASPEFSTATRALAYVSLIYPAFYMAASWYVTLQGWLRPRPPAPSPSP